MSRVMLSIMTLLVLSCTLAAQTQSSSSASQTSNPDQQTTPSTQPTTPGQTGTQSEPMSSTSQSQGTQMISGCLSGPNQEGVYTLRSSRGREIEVGGSTDLSVNVGKQVTLTGQWAKSGSQISEQGKETAERNDRGTSTAATGEHKERGEHHFKVSSVQKIADTCETSGSSTPK